MPVSDNGIRAALMDIARQRGARKTLCPSEVARALADDWRPLMADVRRVAADEPMIEALQGGKVVDPQTAKGPIRLRLAQPR
ncbi:DUF3253 domain-containing protein [Oceaniglobus indicus]|uniref:DUF3253 domain-containing protein n=1 Tax=Oceaniglobus indicus TaxID=2047749 RepID=UPI000C18B11D|nr:DUF3253 domain-containing protein [Oceaniglobus indicus]